MNKQQYIKPQLFILAIATNNNMLAASYTYSVKPSSEEADDGWADAKGGSYWDDDEE